jgi:YHS domain-containing protein/phenylpyruvate tautomerase PptA (4-oxalocrotonate tautomerase family)
VTLIELFAPKGSLDDDQRRWLSERLVTELIAADGAPAELIERGRDITWLIVHEPEVWSVGGRPVDAAERPRYVVRVNVPGGHLNAGMRAEMVARLTRVIAAVGDHPQRVYEQPDAWVHINELPSGNIGAFGQVVSTADITRMVVTGDRPAAAAGGSGDAPAVDTVIDPICGMTVELADTAITLQVDDTVYGFCSQSCRDIFAADHDVMTG